MANQNYHDQVNIDNSIKLRELMDKLPRFCKEFFRGIEPTSSSRTRIAYAYDLGVFFEFLINSNPSIKDTPITELKLDLLDELTPLDIEEYLDYLSYYISEGKEYINRESGKKRKLASLKSFYNYYYKKRLIKNNPASLVSVPKIYDKEIVRLDPDEVALLLDEVENPENLTKSQKKFHSKTKTRDLALMTLLLGTGIRVSECVGLDIDDVDFNNNGIKIRRKGGYEVVIYFGEEVRQALLDYLEERKNLFLKKATPMPSSYLFR